MVTENGSAVHAAQPGKNLVLKDAKIDMFKGSMRLIVGHSGSIIESSEELDFTANVSVQLPPALPNSIPADCTLFCNILVACKRVHQSMRRE
jgi:hypothetical protein